jgi:D-alanyl-lipoteichoic acid acyltransferase DltB (MBOAT superfamily)
MLFTDPAYLFLFLPLSVALFALMIRRQGRTAALGCLFLLSCFFYSRWGYDYLAILIVSILVNWTCAHILLTLSDDAARYRKGVLYLGQTLNFGALIWFKYAFSIAHLLPGTGSVSTAALAIPVGISFYTFQQAVFLVDAYHRDVDAIQYLGQTHGLKGKARGFLRYCALICFFPHLVIGPILYLKEFAPQVANRGFGRITRQNLELGLFILAAGLFKKVVIADNLAPIVDPAFALAAQGKDMNLVTAWSGVLSYYGQLYFDFSGYSDMAIGSARLFGIILPINFDSPLKAVGIIDFYKRWHITLTRVIARFLYTPISLWGARTSMDAGAVKRHLLTIWLPLFVNFQIIALWHGATSTFLLFGVIHGLWYILETEIRGMAWWKRWRKQSSDPLRAMLGRLIFFVPMVACFALFRANNIDTWLHILEAMFGLHGSPLRGIRYADWTNLAIALGGLAFALFLPNLYEMSRSHNPGIITFKNPSYTLKLAQLRWEPNALWGLLMVAGVVTSLYYIGRLPPFLYLNF